MPRSPRDSGDEIETRTGRRTPNPNGSSVHDTQLRRSTRFKPTLKNNESSPESPQSDNNTPQTRITRKRAGTMDSLAVAENVRMLRPRKTSVSPTISDVADTETIGTPSRRGRKPLTTSADTPKTPARTRRLTRAGSEAKSPPASTRTTRRTRASSMGPEGISGGDKLNEKTQAEHTGTPVKTRRRASVMPSEATVVEAKEETKSDGKDNQDETLPEIIEINEESKTSSGKETDQSKETRSPESDATKEQQAVKGQQNFTENVVSARHENTKNDITLNTKESELLNQQKLITTKESSLSGTGTQSSSQNVDEDSSQDGSKDFELQIESTSHESVEEQHSDMSNKENEETHSINDVEQNADNVKTIITLKSPKPLRSVVTNKLGKEKLASPLRESMKNSEYIKEAAHVSLDVSANDVNTSGKTEDLNISVVNITVSHEISEKDETQLRPEVSKSPLLIDNQSDGITSTKTSELLVESNEKSEENVNDAQKTEDNTQRQVTEKEIIDGIEITDITDIEITETEDIGVTEITGIVDDSETATFDGAKEEATDEPMEVSILESCEIISENTTENNEMQTEDVVEDESMKISNSDAKSETIENLKSPSKLNLTDLPAHNEPSETEIVTNVDATNSETAATIEVTDEKSQNMSANVHESENPSLDTSAVHTSDTIQNDTVVNKDEGNLSDPEKIQSSTVPEPQMEPIVERSKKEEISNESSSPRRSLSAVHKSPNQTKSKNTDGQSEKPDKEEKETSKNVTSEIDSDANTECLFQDIPATEWKKKKKQSDNESISSMATEKIENESEAECDLVLVDREAWLAAESFKAAKEKDMSDYDSDDTVVLKSRIDFVKDRINRSAQLQTLVEESDDDDDMSKIVRRKSLSNRRKSVTKSAEKKLNTNASAQANENVTSNDSPQRPASRKYLSKSLIMHETVENDNPSIKNVNLNKSDNLEMCSTKKRKSLNKSVHNISLQNTPGNKSKQDSEIDTDNIQLSSKKKKKSLNKSQINEISDDDLPESVHNSNKKRKDRHSLNKSSKIKEDSDDSYSKKSCDELKESSEEEETDEIPSSLPKNNKKKTQKKDFLAVHVTSDTDETSGVSDSDDVKNASCRLPRFLFAGADSDSDNESNEGSIDSDVKREYNLDGKSRFKFDDDDVPGDECRASESEYSDPNDNGSDLADFVVEDDEVGEEEDDDEDEEEEAEVDADDDEKEEENAEDHGDNIEESDNEKGTKGKLEKHHDSDSHEEEELKADESEESEDGKDVDVELEPLESSQTQKNKLEKSINSASPSVSKAGKKKQQSQTSICIEAEAEEDEVVNTSKKEKKRKSNKSKKNAELDNSAQEHLDELCTQTISGLNKSLECSTPKHLVDRQERFHTSLDTPSITLQTHKKANKISAANLLSSIFSKTDTKDIALKTETPLRKLKKTKKIEKLLHKSLPAELTELSEKTNLSRVISSNVSQLNKAVSTPKPTEDESHREEKLNVSDGTIKTTRKNKDEEIATEDPVNENPLNSDEPTVSDEVERRAISKNLKILAKADALQKLHSELNNNQPKKMKKRKRDIKEAESEIPVVNEKDESPIVIPKKVKRIDTIADKNSKESVDNISKKKKKKKIPSNVEIETDPADTEETEQVLDKPKKKKGKGKSKLISPEIESVSPNVIQNKKNKVAKTLSLESIVSAEKPQKKQKLKEPKSKSPKKRQISNSAMTDSDDEPETISFSKARENAMQAARLAAENIKINKQMKQQRQDKRFEKTSSEKENKRQWKSQVIKSGESEVPKKGIKRLPDEVLENLSDVPKAQAKRRKISKKEVQLLPSRTMSNSGFMESKIEVEESFIPLSSRGSTTQFGIVNLRKLKRQAKKSAAVTSFRQKMLGRNSRQPVSAYMMYLEKQKATGKDNYYGKTF